MAPPVGTNAQHKPYKTRLQSHFGSCNRREMVYDLVYGLGSGLLQVNLGCRLAYALSRQGLSVSYTGHGQLMC